MDDDWMNIEETAALMRRTPEALAQARFRGDGPVFYRISAKTILYKRSEVTSFMESRAHIRTDTPLAASATT